MRTLGEELLPKRSPRANLNSGRRPQDLAAAAVGATAIVAWAFIGVSSIFIWHSFTVDDAFIGWRHGLNLVEHGLFAYNPPPAHPVDAATSPLYGWLSAVPPLGGIDVVLFFKLISLTIAAAYLLIATRLTTNMVNRLLFLFLGIAGPMQAIHLWSGLETGLYVLLAALLGAYALGKLNVSMWTAGLAGVLLILAREEGAFVICAAVWIQYVLPALPHLRAAMKEFLRAAPLWAPSLLTAIIVTAWRVAAFGSPLPNTFATKTSGAQTPLSLMINAYSFLPLVVVAAVIAWLARGKRSQYLWLVAWVVVPGLLLYLPAHLAMNYALRFPYQLLWPVTLAGVCLAQGSAIRRLLYGAICSVLPLAFIPPVGAVSLIGLIDYYPRMSQAMGVFGEALHESGSTGTLVMGDAGLAPYLSDWLVLDTELFRHGFWAGSTEHRRYDQAARPHRAGAVCHRSASGRRTGGPSPIQASSGGIQLSVPRRAAVACALLVPYLGKPRRQRGCASHVRTEACDRHLGSKKLRQPLARFFV